GRAKSARAKRVVLSLDDLYSKCSPKMAHDTADLAELVVTNIEMANYEFVSYKSNESKPKDGWPFLEEVVLIGTDDRFLDGMGRGRIIGNGVNFMRDLGNTPASAMTPERLAHEAQWAVCDLPITIRVIEVHEMKDLGMEGVVGVGAGSANKPCFIVMEYKAGDPSERPIVLVGKGVTFDSGGISIKPSAKMDEMKFDMLGGASVIAAIVTAARLGVKKNVVALVPAVENMPSGSARKPGDILTSLSGKTMEVLNTDAEGRLILADALAYAEKFYDSKLIVSVATLTGAICVALGSHASGLFTSDDTIAATVTALAEESGDYVWRMPMWEEYDDEVKGTVGDVQNIGKSRDGGAIDAAKFLEKAGNVKSPWAHIDMASRMEAASGDHLGKGAAGDPVRLFVRLIERY
ncbi:MAG: leucyl aminopeptidase family protein, partial [bacterium]|nr:leucyl aminopeptidase family protein [bacterium]